MRRRGVIAVGLSAGVLLACAPAAEADVLWDQYAYPNDATAIVEDTFEIADDFNVVVQQGSQFWSVDRIDVAGFASVAPTTFRVRFYETVSSFPADNNFATRDNAPAVALPNPLYPPHGNYAIALNPPLQLGPGRYWVSVTETSPADSDWGWFSSSGQQGGQAVARGLPCPEDWSLAYNTMACAVLTTGPDAAFRLQGTVGPPPPPPNDTTPPTFTRKIARRQSIRDGAIDITLTGGPEDASVTVTGSVKVANRFAAKTLRFKPASLPLPTGTQVKAKLRLAKRAKKAILRALRAGKKPKAKLVITARDQAGNAATQRASVSLKR